MLHYLSQMIYTFLKFGSMYPITLTKVYSNIGGGRIDPAIIQGLSRDMANEPSPLYVERSKLLQ